MRKPNEGMQICSFLWVYYGFPVSCYEGKNVEEVRIMSGYKMGQKDDSEVDCACGIPDSGTFKYVSCIPSGLNIVAAT